MKQHFFRRAAALLLTLALLTGLAPAALAEEGGGGTPPPPSVPATGVTMDQRSLTVEKGRTAGLTATVSPADSTDTLAWTSDTPAVATVAADGVVTALSPGLAKITATAGAFSDICTVTVPGVTLSATSLRLVMGNSETIGKSLFGDAKDQTFEWTSSDGSVARVDVNGKVTALSEGTSVINIQSLNGVYTQSCNVTVIRNEAALVRTSLSAGQVLGMESVLSELRSRCQTLMSSSLSYLTNLNVSTAQGTLYYGYAGSGDTGAGVGGTERYYATGGGIGDRAVSDVTFVPKAGFSGNATISYTGVTAGNQSYTGEILVTVAEVTGIRYTSETGEPVVMKIPDFSDYCLNQNGRDFNYIRFTPPAARYGTLYYNYTDTEIYERQITEEDSFYRTRTPSLANVSFVPADGYTGTFTLSYTGMDTAGREYNGDLRITVTQSKGKARLEYQTAPGTRVNFNASDFNNVSYDATGYALNYVRFSLPASSQGALYYNGSRISSSTNYYRSSSPSISNVSFLPEDDYQGTVNISFTGYDTRGTSFSGTVVVKVERGTASLRYQTTAGSRVNFRLADFSDACYDATGNQLNYVRFTLPSSSQGVLYHNGSNRVSSSTSYYRSSSPYLDDISFLADTDYSGTVSIHFTGYDVRGNSFNDTVTIEVKGKGSSSDIQYKGYSGLRLPFDVADFSEACTDATGYPLNYVRFTLPATSRGVLYYKDDTKLNESTNYYRTGSGSTRLLEDVSFVPDKNYTGTVNLSFTGYDSRGNSFTGRVAVTVSAPTAAEVSYSTGYAAITFQNGDFIDACASALSGSLASVQFTLPDASIGGLYYNFTAPLRYESAASGKYYVNSAPYLNKVSFLPKAGFSGTVHLSFTAWNTKGQSCSGTLRIQVSPSGRSLWFTDMGSHSFAAPAADFLYRYGITKGTTAGKYAPGGVMKRGDFVAMLARCFNFADAGKTSFRDVPASSHYAAAIASAKNLGIVSADSSGNFRPKEAITRESAAIMLCLSMRAAGISVPDGTAEDLAGYGDRAKVSPVAVGPLAALVRAGVFRGDAQGNLKPKSVLSRAEMAVILHRAMT